MALDKMLGAINGDVDSIASKKDVENEGYGNDGKDSQKNPDAIPKLPLGSYFGTDYSKRPQIKLRDDHISALKELCRALVNRDMPARREEIVRVWEAELFWRGYQHILQRSNGGWEFPSVGAGYGQTNNDQHLRSMFETNFYWSYGMSVVSALTRDHPKVRFAPACPNNDGDITAAQAADKLKDVIIRNNNMMELMADMATYLWTDGRAHFYTRYVKDAARFGFKPEQEAEVPEDAGQTEGAEVIPEEGEGQGEGTVEAPKPLKEPRGREVITVHGALEVKVPIKANCLAECEYLMWSREVDLAVAKGMFPNKADDIKVTRGGPGGDDIDRLARINVALGVEDNFITSDSEAYDVTIQQVWLRPAALLEVKDIKVRNELIEMSEQTGFHFIWAGEQYVSCQVAAIEDNWNMILAVPGRYGAHRPALGTAYIPAQKIVNNLNELANDYFINGIPMKYMDADTFDVQNIKNQTNVPGGIRPFIATPGMTKDNLIITEEIIEFPGQLLAFVQGLGEGVQGQLLTGVYPALAGGDTGSNDTGMGIEMQRDNALGRIGLTWRNIKEGIATTMLQAVQCLAINHDEDINVPGSKKGSGAIIVELQDLKGKYLCFPETDENFPQSPTERKKTLDVLMQAAMQDPSGQIAEAAYAPANFELIKNGIGLPSLHLPKAISYENALGAIEVMKKAGPEPNPALTDLQTQLEALQAQVQSAQAPGDLNAEAALQTGLEQQIAQLQEQMKNTPKEVSSVDVDVDVDDSDVVSQSCLDWMRGPEGRAMKNGNDQEKASYQNIKLYFLAQRDNAAKQAAANAKKPQKGITRTVNLADLLKAGVPMEQAVKLLEQIQ